ncbi:potassium transporter 7-like [Carex rostrata]
MSERGSTSSSTSVVKLDSSEGRWISKEELSDGEEKENVGANRGEEDDDDDDDDDDEGQDAEVHRLVRTGPLIDWFDVEALEVTGMDAKIEDEEFDLGRMAFLTLQTFAVVFGDIGLGPLYTFDVIFTKSPIRGDEDVIGALSLVLYTLLLIPLVKYVSIVLWANDDFEGGIFALYSLISRNANISLIPIQFPPDTHMSSFQLKVPSKELERSIQVKQCLESSPRLKKAVLVIVLFGTAMVLSDGVITPAMSVVSAVSGLKVGIPDLKQDTVVMISVAFLVILFSIQKYATSKMGFAIGPALFLWFCCLGGIGIYNLAKYGVTVFKAFNPVYIIVYFKRNSFHSWLALGGCLLCATGSEAIFADLCHFSVRSIQYTFVLFVLPCLLLGYLGQAAFLLANQTSYEHIFFSSIPGGTFWPVLIIANIAALIASRTMTTATFACINKSIALGCFPRLKIIHTSRKFMGQIYIPFINWFLMVFCALFLVSFRSVDDIGIAYGITEVGVMMMTTILVTIIMVLIWQINLYMILIFFCLFIGLELIFFSSLLTSIGSGSWVMLLFSMLLLLVMVVWNYGTKLKYDSEIKQMLSMELIKKLGGNLGTIRAPGVGLLCSELVKGIPAVFGQFLTTLPAIHSIVVFVSIKYIPVPMVPQTERFLFQRVCPRNYHLFRCIARYGYKDVRKEHHKVFERLLIEGLEKFIEREVQELFLQSDDDFDSDEIQETSRSTVVTATNGSFYSLDVPLLSDYQVPTNLNYNSKPSSSISSSQDKTPDYAKNLELERSFIKKAKELGAVYLLSNGRIRATKESWFFRKLILNYFYTFLRNNCGRGITTVSIPHGNLLQVRTTYMV